MVDDNEEINLLEYWNVLWRRKILILAIVMISAIVTMVYSFTLPKYYKSETVIMAVGSEAGGLGAALSSLPFAGALTGVAGIQTPADKIMVILKSRTTAEAVIRRFDLLKVFNENKWDAAKNNWKDPEKPPLMMDTVKVLTTDVTKFNKSKEGAITITVEWKDPKLAAEIANYFVFALTEFLKDKSVNTTIQVVDKAVPAEKKSRPSIRQNIMLAGVVSGFIGIFLAFFLEYLSKQKKK
jgi:uncharacterized protein involved in exopolysaccharide biosynthesis